MVALLFAVAALNSSRVPAYLSGGDVSEIPEVEAAGGRYCYRGKPDDPFHIFRKAGWNLVRFRIWNSPKGGLCDEAATLKLARRAAAQGLNISLDFHYSDWWADPGKQFPPAAWKTYDLPAMCLAVHHFTRKVVADMVAQGTPPLMVQVGNEITAGMLWPLGKVQNDDPVQWHNLGKLVQSGINGVHDGEGKARILTMIHLDRGGDNKGAVWWFDHMRREKVSFDLIGLSYYPFWHGTLSDLTNNLNDLVGRYGKDVMVVETAYPWVVADSKQQTGAVFDGKTRLLPGFAATKEGQAAFVRRLQEILHAVSASKGKGLLYWAPAWISGPRAKTPYANLATFDYNGNALDAVNSLSARPEKNK